MTANEQFTKGLARLSEAAEKKDGSLEIRDILAAFPGMELSAEQVKVIYAYLAESGISLKDYTPHDTNSISLSEAAEEALLSDGGEPEEEEQKVLNFYLEDLEAVKPLSGEEEKALAAGLLSGSAAEKKQAASRLAEGNLRWVIALARGFAGKGAAVSDLIQEGNMGLLLALAEYDGGEELSVFLEKRIKASMKAFLKEQAGFARLQENMVTTANRILELTKEMEAEEGRPVTAAELSEKLGISASKVDEVLRESAKAIQNAQK